MIGNFVALIANLHHIARRHDNYIFLRNSHGFGQSLLRHQVAVLAVYRNCVFRTYQGIHQLDFFLAGMSRYVGILENHLSSLHGKLIDYLGHCLFITRNRC